MSDLEMIKPRDEDENKESERVQDKDTVVTVKTMGPLHEPCCYDLCIVEPTGCCCGSFKKRNNVWHCVFFILMMIFFFIAIIVPLIIYSAIDTAVYDYVIVDSPSSITYDSWKTNRYGDGLEDGQIVYNVYLFDVQNPKEITQGEKPIVVERGPFSYDSYTEKFDISFPRFGKQILYNQWKYYVFNKERSGPGLSEDYDVTLPYNAVIGFEFFLYSLPPEIAGMLPVALFGMALQVQMRNNMELDYLALLTNTLNITAADRTRLTTSINSTKASSNQMTTSISTFFTTSNAALIFMKLMLCQTQSPNGISPFWVTQPNKAWFGYFNDPLLTNVGMLLKQASQGMGMPPMPFTTAVPGITPNYTSIADARRRRTPVLMNSGQQNIKHIAQFIKYQNSTRIWNCAFPLNSQDPTKYKEGEEFPACAHFQSHWTDAQAMAAGYVKPWATDEANTFEGSDGGIYGRPVVADKLKAFLSDIFRSLYLKYTGNQRFRGVNCRRYELQDKDLASAATNPENAVYYQFGPDGLANFTSATAAAAFASRPHFLGADPSLQLAIDGMRPNKDIHDTYLLIHPATGLLAQAKKRLQTNLLMRSINFPQTQGLLVTTAIGICVNISRTTAELAEKGGDVSQLTPRNCQSDQLTGLVGCMATPVSWNYQNGHIFFPYGWAEEMTEATQEKADNLQMADDLDMLAKAIRVWAIVLAICCFIVQIALVLYRCDEVLEYFEDAAQHSEDQKYFVAAADIHDPELDAQEKGVDNDRNISAIDDQHNGAI